MAVRFVSPPDTLSRLGSRREKVKAMQGPIRHSTNSALFDYWQSRRGERIAPSRADIEPADIHAHLADTFILQTDALLPARFRLAGSRVCTIFNRELKGENLADLWEPVDADTIKAALRIMQEDASCCVVRFKGYTARDNNVAGEMLLMPLTMGDSDIIRILGSMTTFDLPYWLGTDPISTLRIKAINMIEPKIPALAIQSVGSNVKPLPVGPAIPGARRVGHLTVLEGGRDGS